MSIQQNEEFTSDKLSSSTSTRKEEDCFSRDRRANKQFQKQLFWSNLRCEDRSGHEGVSESRSCNIGSSQGGGGRTPAAPGISVKSSPAHFRLRSNSMQKPANCESGDLFTLFTYDRCGVLKDYHIKKGDVCVVGSNREQLLAMAQILQEAFTVGGEESEIISPLAYMRQAMGDLPEGQRGKSRIILVHLGRTIFELAEVITIACPTRIFFALPDLYLTCPLTCRVRDSEESNRLVASLGGDFTRRKTLLASLNQHEFLVVLDEKEEVRNLLEHPSVEQILSTLRVR